jgi:hypothetical protein
MKTPVHGIRVLLPAAGAHGETGHGSPGTIIGDTPGYGVARAAIGAIYERIKISRITRVEEFTQTILTNTYVRTDEYLMFFLPGAFGNLELLFRGLTRDILFLHTDKTGQRGKIMPEGPGELANSPVFPLYLDLDPFRSIQDKTGQAQGCGGAIDKRPKTHSLHLPVYNIFLSGH